MSVSVAADEPISILLPENYAKSHSIDLDGKTVSGPNALNKLSQVIITRGRNIPVVVLIPDSLRFADYYNVRGLVQKVGFLNVRYFVFAAETRRMVQFHITSKAQEFSRKPAQ